jgi:hypothetical protein
MKVGVKNPKRVRSARKKSSKSKPVVPARKGFAPWACGVVKLGGNRSVREGLGG